MKAQRRKMLRRRNTAKVARRRKSSATDTTDRINLLTIERDEALEQQRATSEVLKAISSSPGEPEPVFKAMLESALRICEAKFGMLMLYRGDGSFDTRVMVGAPPGLVDALLHQPFTPPPGVPLDRMLRTKQTVHTVDAAAEKTKPLSAKLAGARSHINVPMLKDSEVVGSISIYRTEVRPFTDKQIELVTNFAAQAAIAIENARLFDEVQAKTRDLQEALVHQTGSANILRVIASSPTDVKPVLEAIVESACELCNADDAVVHQRQGEDLQYGAHHGGLPVGFKRHAISRDFVAGRSVVDKIPVHIHDVLSGEGDDFPEAQRMSRQTGLRTILSAPMLRESECIGAIVLRRKEVRPFTDKQIALLQTFADQAVIAIENVRLFDEVQAKTRDLEESLQQQTATADVLKVISRSAFDLRRVLDTLVETVARLCRANQAVMFRRLDALYHPVASHGVPGEAEKYLVAHPLSPDRGTLSGRVELERRPVHVDDVLEDPEYSYQEGQKIQGYRTMLGIPLLREDALIGIFVINRTHVEPFTKQEIELATTFADQAVIAIENARLFEATVA